MCRNHFLNEEFRKISNNTCHSFQLLITCCKTKLFFLYNLCYILSFRETTLLIDPEVATIDNVHEIAENIAHELAHQWFGNLVTINWWTDSWLKEGFATYVAARGVDFVSFTMLYCTLKYYKSHDNDPEFFAAIP